MPVIGIGQAWDVDVFSTQAAYTIEDIDFNGTPQSSSRQTGDLAQVLNAVASGIPETGYAARLSTTITLDRAEDIAFYLAAAGDATVYVDGVAISEVRCETLTGAATGPCPNTGGSMCLCNAENRYGADSDLATIGAGTHEIVIEYLNHVDGDVATLDWAIGNEGRRPFDLEVPETDAFSADGALRYQFFDGTPVAPTADAIPASGELASGAARDFDVQALALGLRDNDDNFQVRYSGQINIETGGTYTFATTSDDGSKLYINGFEVVDNDGYHGPQTQTGSVDLTAGVHDIQVLYFQGIFGQSLDVDVSGADTGGASLDLFDSGIELASVTSRVDQDLDGGGEWQGVQDWPLIGLHAIIMPNFEVLTFGTDENGVQTGQVVYDVWDYATDTHYTLPNTTGTDIFCSVPFYDPVSGRVIIAGGDARPLGSPNQGVEDANVYDPKDRTLSELETGDMNYARWYETAVTLSNGKVMLIGGIDTDGVAVGRPEIYTPGVGFKTLDGLSQADVDTLAEAWFYTRAFPTSDGRVVVLSSFTDGTMHMIDPSGDGSMEYYGDLPISTADTHPAVMYAQDKFAMMDGNGALWSVDFSGDAPAAELVADLGGPRHYANMLILPNGEVMLLGGGSTWVTTDYGTPNKSVVTWNPTTGAIETHESEALARLYHSSAILLPDGTVMSMGGGAPGPLTNTNAENFRPDYLYDSAGDPADRLVILDAPAQVEQRESLRIKVSDPSAVDRVTMVKNGSVTHTFNMETRFEELEFTVDADGYITATPSENSNVFTAGGWMLFVLDEAGVPSHAASVVVGLGGEHYAANVDSYFTLNGDAEALSSDEFLLTPDQANTDGAAISTERIDFSDDFALTFEINMGVANAGDGMTVLFHNDPYSTDATGTAASGLGALGIENGFGIEFDVQDDVPETPAQHMQFFGVDGDTRSLFGTPQTPANFDDGTWHEVQLVWEATTKTLSYSFDGVLVDAVSRDLPLLHFGDTAAHLAFTAASGEGGKAQSVRLVEFDGYFENDAQGVEARPDVFAVDEDASVTGNLLADNGNGADLDARGNALSIAGVEGDADGSVTLSSGAIVSFAPDGNFTYDPNGAFDGLSEGQSAEDKFLYTAQNEDGDQDAQLVRVTVNGISDEQPTQFGAIRGYVFNDMARDDVYGDGDGLVQGVSVILRDASGAEVANSVTNAVGVYKFDDVPYGDYYLEVETSDTQIFVAADQGAIEGRDSDVTDLSAGTTDVFTIDSADTLRLQAGVYDDGSVDRFGDVQGFVFHDVNDNSVFDAGDAMRAGVGVVLHADDGETITTTTNASGLYHFDDVLFGSYELEFLIDDALQFVTANQGANDGRDSDVTDDVAGRTDAFQINSEEIYRFQAGVRNDPSVEQFGALRGYVFDDNDGDGIYGEGDDLAEGILVRLLNSDLSEVATATTTGFGGYRFDDVAFGDYLLEFALADGFEFVTPDQGTIEGRDSDVTDTALGRTDVFSVTMDDIYRLQAGIDDLSV